MFMTLTGADNSTNPHALIELAERYAPGQVEFGILYSSSRRGTGRYPTRDWINNFVTTVERSPSTRRALHLCGRDAILEYLCDDGFVATVAPHFQRVQLNLRAADYVPDLLSNGIAKHKNQTVITQHNKANAGLSGALIGLANHAILFDESGGRGTRPEYWQRAFSTVPHGYAGGLGPDNLAVELTSIKQVASSGWWVDMESKLRDAHDKFDVGRAEQCAAIFERSVCGVMDTNAPLALSLGQVD